MRSVEFEGANNMRDLGGIEIAYGRVLRSGLIYRGGALAKITATDQEKIAGNLGVTRVIDVRTGWERAKKPDVDIPGVENLFIPFFDNDIVGIEYTKALPGTIRIGRDFACDSIDFYGSMPNPLTARQMKRALDAVFENALASRATLVHCSGGKDRAGIMALLILEVLGASRQSIMDDYLATNESREENIQPIYERFLRLCEGDEEFARSVTAAHRARPENLESFYRSVDERYGSMDAFLTDILGYDFARRASLAEQLS